MRFTILVSLFFASINAQAQALNKNTCSVQGRSTAELQKATQALPPAQYLVGTVSKSMLGNLNSEVLEGGAIVIVKTVQGSYVIFDGTKNTPVSKEIELKAKRGLKHVAINRRCLAEVAGRDAEHEVSGIGSEFVRGPFKTLELSIRAPQNPLRREFSCTRDDEADDWVVSGTLGAREINLFDNDSNSTFVMRPSTQSSTYLYIEKRDPTNSIKVVNSAGRLKAFYSGEDKNKIAFSCVFE